MHLDGTERIIAAVITGVVAGLVSGTMGVGGGIVMVPAMVIFMGIDQVIAQGISLAVIIPTALSGATQHYRLGHVDVRRALTIGIGGLIGGFGGAQVAQVAAAGGAAGVVCGVPAVLGAADAGGADVGDRAAAAGALGLHTEKVAHIPIESLPTTCAHGIVTKILFVKAKRWAVAASRHGQHC